MPNRKDVADESKDVVVCSACGYEVTEEYLECPKCHTEFEIPLSPELQEKLDKFEPTPWQIQKVVEIRKLVKGHEAEILAMLLLAIGKEMDIDPALVVKTYLKSFI